MVSPDDPADGAVDRPRMAEALASLKEGLRESADPLYDGWKRRPGAGAAQGNAAAASNTGVDRPAPSADTVRVRVIRYQVFPKWALITAASMVVFSASVVALRIGLRSTLRSPPSPDSGQSSSPRRGPSFAPDLAVVADPAMIPSDPPLGAAADQAFAALPAPPSAVSAPPLPPMPFSSPPRAASPPPATKQPSPPPRRKPATHDTGFFRDPGF